MNKKKKRSPARFITLLVMVLISAYCILEVVKEVNTNLSLRADISDAEAERTRLEKEKEQLEKEKSNLSNEEYVVRYARGKYMLTETDDEQVFKLPTEEKEEEQ